MQLRDKRVVLVGASSGIGRSLALELARHGTFVIAMARRQGELDALVDEIRAGGGAGDAFAIDTSDREQVRAAYEHASRDGEVDGLIYNAGVSHATIWSSLSADETRRLFEVNFFGFMYWLEHLLPPMRARRAGFLAATTALCAYRSIPSGGEYAATKGALGNLLEGLRIDHQIHGVKVFQLMPGIVTSPMSEMNNMEMPLEISAERAARIIVKGLRRDRTRIEFGPGMARVLRIMRSLPDGMYARAFRSSFVVPRANMERMMENLPPFECPEHRIPLVFDRYASLECPQCDRRFTMVKGHMDLLDGSSLSESASDEKVKLAYRFYALVYPVVALFALWFIWAGSIRHQLRFYRERVRDAADRKRPFLDVATGDGSLTQLVLRKVDGQPEFLAVDISRDMLRKASRKFRKYPSKFFYICDIGRANLPDGSYPDILCFGGLHVFSDPKGALEHMRRILSDDGALSGSYLLRPGTRRRDRLVDWCIDKGLLSSSMPEDELDALFAEVGFEYSRKERSGKMLLFSLVKRGAEAAATAT